MAMDEIYDGVMRAVEMVGKIFLFCFFCCFQLTEEFSVYYLQTSDIFGIESFELV
jgi:hypothetical protein